MSMNDTTHTHEHAYPHTFYRFGVAEAVIHESVDMVVSTINRLLDNINFPASVSQCEQNAAKFGLRNSKS